MPTRSTAVTPGTLEGRITNLRVGVPQHLGGIHLRIDGVPVHGAIEDADALRTLRDLQHLRKPVRMGVLTNARGAHQFAWLVCPGKQGIAPRTYGNEQRRSGRTIAGGLALGVAALGLAWVLGIGALWRALVLALLLAVALMGFVFAGVALQAMWRNRLWRPALLASDAAYQHDDGRPPKAAALVEAPPEPVAPPAKGKRGGRILATPKPVPKVESRLADDGQPPIGHVRGPLAALTHESIRSVNSGPSWGVYRFKVGQEAYVMRVGEEIGNPVPFLAEGDVVEMAVHAGDSPRLDQHRLVYAMRNLEDGRVYVCHRTFRGSSADIAPIGVGPTQRGPLLRTVAGFIFITWLIVLGVFAFAGSNAGMADLPVVAAWGLGVGAIVWGCVAMPLAWWQRRWRQGRPTRRQQTLERIYRVLDLGTPLAPAVTIEEM